MKARDMPSILIMEDQEDQAHLIAEWLELSGYDVCVTHSIEAALSKLLGAHRFDLLITDIFAPRSDEKEIERGVTLMRRIRTSQEPHLHALPIISISGVRIERSHAYRFDRPETLGSNIHLAKPFDFSLLTEAIETLLYEETVH